MSPSDRLVAGLVAEKLSSAMKLIASARRTSEVFSADQLSELGVAGLPAALRTALDVVAEVKRKLERAPQAEQAMEAK